MVHVTECQRFTLLSMKNALRAENSVFKYNENLQTTFRAFVKVLRKVTPLIAYGIFGARVKNYTYTYLYLERKKVNIHFSSICCTMQVAREDSRRGIFAVQ